MKVRSAALVKSLANVSKNYRGKLQGLKRTHLVAQKMAQEKAYLAQPANAAYVAPLRRLDSLNAQVLKTTKLSLWVNALLNNSALMRNAASEISANQLSESTIESTRRKLLANARAFDPAYELPLLTFLTTDTFIGVGVKGIDMFSGQAADKWWLAYASKSHSGRYQSLKGLKR